jgi:hypothetical protein
MRATLNSRSAAKRRGAERGKLANIVSYVTQRQAIGAGQIA